MSPEIAKRLIPIFKQDVKRYRRQTQEAEHKLQSNVKATKYHFRYMRKLTLFSVCHCLLIECYNI